jgi:hypothetical protein
LAPHVKATAAAAPSSNLRDMNFLPPVGSPLTPHRVAAPLRDREALATEPVTHRRPRAR